MKNVKILYTTVAVLCIAFACTAQSSHPKDSDTVSAKFGNSVSGDSQMLGNRYVFLEGDKIAGGLLCVGHSLTKHAPSPKIGWYNNCGMAASKKENDFVHLLWTMLKTDSPDIPLCIAQASFFERNFVLADDILPRYYHKARDFKAKWIVISIGDNVPQKMAADNDFIKYYEKLVDYVNPTGKAKLIITTTWYPVNLSDKLKEFAKSRGIKIVDIAKIAEKPEMHATGLYAHKGVASHPSDAGMAALAAAYYKALTE